MGGCLGAHLPWGLRVDKATLELCRCASGSLAWASGPLRGCVGMVLAAVGGAGVRTHAEQSGQPSVVQAQLGEGHMGEEGAEDAEQAVAIGHARPLAASAEESNRGRQEQELVAEISATEKRVVFYEKQQKAATSKRARTNFGDRVAALQRKSALLEKQLCAMRAGHNPSACAQDGLNEHEQQE
eukprot:gene36991-63158_t